jgi:hypothetical protein
MRASRYPYPEGTPWTGPFPKVSEVERARAEALVHDDPAPAREAETP